MYVRVCVCGGMHVGASMVVVVCVCACVHACVHVCVYVCE